MSRTALRSFIALGISISLAAACGDDDGGDDGNGGSAGNAGSNGMSGSSGSGTGGTTAGSSGSAGMAGSSGSANGGTGGGGQGGQGGGQGGSPSNGGSAPDIDAGDAGLDGSVDDEPDGSVGTGGTGGAGGTGGSGGSGGGGSTPDCPAVQNVIDANNNQDIGIVRVLFEDDTVAIRNLATPVEGDAGASTLSLSSVFLCNGPEDCVDLGEDGDCDVFELEVGEEAVCEVPDVLDTDGGELSLTNALPTDPGVFIRSYLAWGVFVSPDIPGAGTTSLEDLASAGGPAAFWDADARIDAPTGTEDAIFADGDLGDADTYDVCTQD
jgi:hypothetical protein